MTIKKILLTEALSITDGKSIVTAIEKGMIPGIKKSVFFGDKEPNIVNLNSFVTAVKLKSNQNNFIQFFLFAMKKIKTQQALRQTILWNKLYDWMDSVAAYLANKNKQEFKNNPEYKKKLEDYENSPIDINKDKEFEQWINKTFADKAKVKDINKEIEIVYSGKGWTVLNPLTFAAAKEAAGMNNRKATWCTASRNDLYNSYTDNGKNKLFVIKNEAKDVMFQMDFGKNGLSNFKNEKDISIKKEEFLKNDIPDDLLKSIKNKKGKSLFDIFDEIKKNNAISGPETKMNNGWAKRILSVDEVNSIKRLQSSHGVSLEKEIDFAKYVPDREVFEIKKGDKIFYLLNYTDKTRNLIYQKVGDKLVKKSLKTLISAKEEIVPRELIKMSIPPIGEDEDLNKKVKKAPVQKYSNITQLAPNISDIEFGRFKRHLTGSPFETNNFLRVEKDDKAYYYSLSDKFGIVKMKYDDKLHGNKYEDGFKYGFSERNYFAFVMAEPDFPIGEERRYAKELGASKEVMEKFDIVERIKAYNTEETTPELILNIKPLSFNTYIKIEEGLIPNIKWPNRYNFENIIVDGEYVFPNKRIYKDFKVKVSNKKVLQMIKDLVDIGYGKYN